MMVNIAIENVCRLCLTTDDLVWIFDKRFESSDNMKDVIHITTGVEITAKDIISQKICKKCCQVTIKMFEFRRSSLKNDQHLKEQCKILLKDKEIKIPNSQVTIRSQGVTDKDPRISFISEKKTDTKIDELDVNQKCKPLYKIHPSVRKLFKVHPHIKLPTVCLKYNISPCVAMTMDQVENYFKIHNLDFQEYTKLALKPGKVATKRTSTAVKTKSTTPPKTTTTTKILKTDQKDTTSKCQFKVEVPHTTEPADNTSDYIGSKSTDISPVSNVNKIDLEQQKITNKRKFSETEEVEKRQFKKTNFVESLGLTPKDVVTDPPGNVLSYVSNKSLPLHICDICNAVHYSAKDLRKHQNKHLRCQFCKMKLRNLDSKEEHLNGMCSIKNIMNNLPEIQLERIECKEWARRKYPEAFKIIPQQSDLVMETSSVTKNDSLTSVVCAKELSDSQSNAVHDSQSNAVQDDSVQIITQPPEIIEILSDDEEPSTSVPKTTKETILNTPLLKPILPIQQKPPVSNIGQPPQPDNVVYSTVSIVRPDIRIKGNNVLDMIDARLTDIKVLKELLTVYRPVELYAEKMVQTELPCSSSISVNNIFMTAELKMLKPQLHVFKIPIIFKNGKFDVRYNYPVDQDSPKKLCLWNDVKKVDIKLSKVLPAPQPARSDISPKNQMVLPSTATYNSPGTFVASTHSATPTTSKFIRVNASSLSPITTATYSPPASNSINTNPLLGNLPQNGTCATTESTGGSTTTSAGTSSASTAAQPFGSIRVKNVWELT